MASTNWATKAPAIAPSASTSPTPGLAGLLYEPALVPAARRVGTEAASALGAAHLSGRLGYRFSPSGLAHAGMKTQIVSTRKALDVNRVVLEAGAKKAAAPSEPPKRRRELLLALTPRGASTLTTTVSVEPRKTAENLPLRSYGPLQGPSLRRRLHSRGRRDHRLLAVLRGSLPPRVHRRSRRFRRRHGEVPQ